MAKNDNAHAVRLVASLEKHVGQDIAKEFEAQYPLSKSADIEKKYQWARTVCSYLEEHFDADTVISIRKDCRCNDGKSIADKLIRYLNRAENLQEFVAIFNQNETFASIEYISDRKIRICYPQCYCACVKRAPGGISKTWCYCTLGNAEGIFREVFKTDVKVTLIESIKSGADRCAMDVEW